MRMRTEKRRNIVMVDEHRDDLDVMLAKRSVPKAPAGLAEQIIARAYRDEGNRKAGSGFSFWDYVPDLTPVFAIPRPAYACAVMIALGVLLGFTMDAGGVSDDEGASDVSAYLLLEDNMYRDLSLYDEGGALL